MAILIRVERTAGAGNFIVWPMSKAVYSIMADDQAQKNISILPIVNQEMLWENSVANDAWTVVLFGYFVQPRTR